MNLQGLNLDWFLYDKNHLGSCGNEEFSSIGHFAVEFSGTDDWQGQGEVEIVLVDGTKLIGSPAGATQAGDDLWQPLSDGQSLEMVPVSNGEKSKTQSFFIPLLFTRVIILADLIAIMGKYRYL